MQISTAVRGSTPNTDHQYFKSFDLGLCSALVCCGYELFSLDKTDVKKVQFVFARDEKIDNVINQYWSNKLKVEARAYFDSLKMLKNRIYSQ